jgi:hypothetical protein
MAAMPTRLYRRAVRWLCVQLALEMQVGAELLQYLSGIFHKFSTIRYGRAEARSVF